MIGLQCFYPPDDQTYPRTRVIENHLRWLTETLGIPKEEITFIEDVWAGGGNLGACVEFFIQGMEVGNMVFMEFKADMIKKTWTKLPIRVVDVGIGLERIPFLVNGSATSYLEAFGSALKFIEDATGAKFDDDLWLKFGTYSCRLNIDECDDIDATWKEIAKDIGMDDVDEMRRIINIGRDLIVVADHLRTFLVAVEDGALPSSTGGGSNLRNLIRRVFAVLHQRQWFDKIGGIDGIMRILDIHREELKKLYGTFTSNPAMKAIIQKEYDKWRTTDAEAEGHIKDFQKQRAKEIAKQKKAKKADGAEKPTSSNGSVQLEVQDWIMLTTTYGVMPDQIERVTGQVIPQNYYTELAETKERLTKQLQTGVNQYASQAAGLPETDEILYHRIPGRDDGLEQPMDLDNMTFSANVIGAFTNVTDHGLNLVILDRTLFYPLSGGQDNDTGVLTITFPGQEAKQYKVVDVIKCGNLVAHKIEPALTQGEYELINATRSNPSLPRPAATGTVDRARRFQLACHHTATHLVHAAAHEILGSHVFQASAKKTVQGAHLDITHYSAITPEEIKQIQQRANEFVQMKLPIFKNHMPKEEAEKKYGFSLYQGGVVPGKVIRVVAIGKPGAFTDVEACCGSHLNNTGDIQLIRITATRHISDGAVRLEFTAGPRARESYEEQDTLIKQVCQLWDTTPSDILTSANKFFRGFKDNLNLIPKYQSELIKRAFLAPNGPFTLVYVPDSPDPTWCISRCPAFAKQAIIAANSVPPSPLNPVRIGERNRKWGVVFVGASYLIGVLGWVPPKTPAEAEEKKRVAKEEEEKKRTGTVDESLPPLPTEPLDVDNVDSLSAHLTALLARNEVLQNEILLLQNRLKAKQDAEPKKTEQEEKGKGKGKGKGKKDKKVDAPSPFTVEDITFEGLTQVVELAQKEKRNATQEAPSDEKAKKVAPFLIEVGKGTSGIPVKESEPLPAWTVSLKCLSLRASQLVAEYFLSHGFVRLDL